MKKFRLWDIQYNEVASFSTSSLHCFGERVITENAEVIEFVGSLSQDGDFYGKESTNYLDSKCRLQKRFQVQLWTGLLDINGKEIFEGDTVVEYPDNRQIEEVEDDVFFLGAKRGPLKDIIVYNGKVVWAAPRFVIEIQGRADGVTAVDMAAGNNYEIV